MKIMIVEDHAEMRKVLKNVVLMSDNGSFEIIECDNGEQAIGNYALHQPDIVLMDVQLGKMNGLQATEEIYKTDAQAKVIIVTSHDSSSIRRKAKKLHTSGFVRKDHLQEVTSILENFLNPA